MLALVCGCSSGGGTPGISEQGEAGGPATESDAAPNATDTTLAILSPAEGPQAAPVFDLVTEYNLPTAEPGAEVALSIAGAPPQRKAASPGESQQVKFTVDLSAFAKSNRPVELRARLESADGSLLAEASVQVTVGQLSQAIVELKELATRPVVLDRYEDGTLEILQGGFKVEGADAVERARAFLDVAAPLYGIERPRETLAVSDRVFAEPEEEEPAPAYETVQFVQHVQGVPIAGTDFTVHLRGNVVQTAFAAYVASPPAELPAIEVSHQEALAIAAATLDETIDQRGPRLSLWSARMAWDPLAEPMPEDTTEPAWRFRLYGSRDGAAEQWWTVTVSAQSGDVLEVESSFDHSVRGDPRVDIKDAAGAYVDICPSILDHNYWDGERPRVCDADDCNDGAHADVVAAQQLSLLAHEYWNFKHCRLSFDNHNDQIEIYARTDMPGNVIAAYSRDCQNFQFETGWVTTDVFGHEFAHGVLHNTVDLQSGYSKQTLNEGLSDIFGGLLLAFQREDDRYPCDESNGSAESRCDPAAIGNADHISEYDRSRSLYSNNGIVKRAVALAFRTGVHENSGIPVERPVGFHRLEDTLYDVLRFGDIPSSANTLRFLRALRARTRQNRDNSRHGISSPDLCTVTNAVAAVSYEPTDLDCDEIYDNEEDDFDDDGYPNDVDNCPRFYDPSQLDTDGDGQGNVCDSDIDGDGITNGEDNCTFVVNPGQADSGGGRFGDACEDQDEDGIVDSVDNCINEPNPVQFDRDSDGKGDECDSDDDGDSVPDSIDRCPFLSSSNNRDSDGDDVGDPCDNCVLTPNPRQRDTDKDGEGDECDPDDDDDGLLDADDNCPTAHNPSQYDGDDNGIGFECDGAEQAAEFQARFDAGVIVEAEYYAAQRMHMMPLNVCMDDACPQGGWEPGAGIQLFTETSAPVGLVIVDDLGSIVAKADTFMSMDGAIPTTRTGITLYPDATSATLAAGAPDLSQTRYSLVVIPLLDRDFSGIDLELELSAEQIQSPTP